MHEDWSTEHCIEYLLRNPLKGLDIWLKEDFFNLKHPHC